MELFNRTKANVDLSAAGERLLGYARRILTLNEEAIGRLAERKVEGVVRLGVMDDYGTFIIPPLLANFLAGYPKIHIEMETGLTSSMPARLGEAYDLVIAMHPEGRGEGEFLRREQAVWAAAPSQAVEDQEPLPVALYPQGCLFRKWAIEALDAAKRPWRLAFVSHSLASRGVRRGPGSRRDCREGRHLSAEAASAVASRRHAATAGRGHPPASRCQSVTGRRASRGSFANEHLEAS